MPDGNKRFCANCGKELNTEEKFCRQCGSPVQQNPAVPVQTTQPLQPVQQQLTPPPQPVQQITPVPQQYIQPVPQPQYASQPAYAILLSLDEHYGYKNQSSEYSFLYHEEALLTSYYFLIQAFHLPMKHRRLFPYNDLPPIVQYYCYLYVPVL